MRGENIWLGHKIDTSVDFLLNRRQQGPKIFLNERVKKIVNDLYAKLKFCLPGHSHSLH